jgi:hypothetical protein
MRSAIAVCCVAGAMLLATSGCSSAGSSTGKGAGSAATSAPVGQNMAGPAQQVIISKEALANKPAPWVLSTPQAAVRSYLDWTSYAYRIAQSEVATPTMSAKQEVRVDSYTQLNLEKSQLIDQTLRSITFGSPSTVGTRTLLPAKEDWTYRYVSIQKAGQTIAGPYSVSYDTTYTVVKTSKGWVVDSIQAKALGTVK